MKKMIAMLLAVVMILSLCACSGKEYDEALLGVYTCYEIEAIGYAMSPDEVWSDTCTIELKQGGKGSMHIDGEDASVKYDIVGESIEITVEGETATGSLVDGIIEVELMGLTMRLAQEGVTPPTGTTEEPVDDPATEVDPGTEPEAPAESSVSLDPVSGSLGSYDFTILAAEHFTDQDGNPAIRFYLDFTNNGTEIESLWDVTNLYAYQSGYELVETYADSEDDVAEYGNNYISIAPGVTIRCIAEFAYQPEGGTVEFKIEGYTSDDILTMEFDPNALQGRPAELEKVLIPNPTNTEDLAAEGVIEDVYNFEILSYEVVPGYSVDNVARIYIEFTNNSDEATSYFLSADEIVLQDGMEIDTALADESVEEEDNYSVEIEPGQSITVARSFELSSDSPVEFIITDFWNESPLGIMVPVV